MKAIILVYLSVICLCFVSMLVEHGTGHPIGQVGFEDFSWIILLSIIFFVWWKIVRKKKRDREAALRLRDDLRIREWEWARKDERDERNKLRYDAWLKGTPGKLSQKGFSSLGSKDRDELFFIYQLLMNGGDLNKLQKRLMEIALADSATSKFLELRGSQGNVPSPENSLSPQMPVAFGALGIAAGAGIVQRGQIRQELNEINENLDEVSEDLDKMSGGEADPSGFDFF